MKTQPRSTSFREGLYLLSVFCFLWTMFVLPSAWAGDRLAENKRIAVAFLNLMANEKKPREAYDKYVSEDYVHHIPGIAPGKDAMVAALTPFLTSIPDAVFDIKRVVAEGDLVVLHIHEKNSPDDKGRAVADFFRVVDGKIVEHWLVNMPIPDTIKDVDMLF